MLTEVQSGFEPEELSPEEAAQQALDARLAREVDAERQRELAALHGKTEQDLEREADALLAKAGETGLVRQTNKIEEDFDSEQYALTVNKVAEQSPRRFAALIQRQEQTGLAPYTPDAVISLSSQSLVSLINRITQEEEGDDPLISALQTLENTPLADTPRKRAGKLSASRFDEEFKEHDQEEQEAAFDPLIDFVSQHVGEEEESELEDDGEETSVIKENPVQELTRILTQELAERLMYADIEQRTEIIDALNKLDESGLSVILQGDTVILDVLISCAHELSNDGLRNTLLRIQSLREEPEDDA